jgi:hypothetical protein
VLIVSIGLGTSTPLQNSKGNLTIKSPSELADLSDILLEQEFHGVDLATFVQYMGHSHKQHSPEEYLNDSELNDVVISSDDLIQSYSDLINQSTSLIDQGKYNESLVVYNKALERKAELADAWGCKCSAMNILGEHLHLNASESEAYTIKCMDCEYNAEQATYARPDSNLESLENKIDAMEHKINEEKRKEDYLAAFNASGIKIERGLYNSSKVFVPMSPYELSFETRTIGEMSVSNRTLVQYAGSGKTYHRNNFTIYQFKMEPNHYIDIAQYTGPASYTPEEPFDELEAAEKGGFTIYDTEPITIDGKIGTKISSYYVEKPNRPDRYVVTYKLDETTFVQINSRLDYDKDVALILETIRVSKA